MEQKERNKMEIINKEFGATSVAKRLGKVASNYEWYFDRIREYDKELELFKKLGKFIFLKSIKDNDKLVEKFGGRGHEILYNQEHRLYRSFFK